MAFTYDPRLDTELIIHEMGRKLSVSESNLNNELQKQMIFAGKLHDPDCNDKTVLCTGHNCCDTNIWINKARKVSEAVIYSYNQIMNAPHADKCMYHKSKDCTCWKTPAATNIIKFIQAIG